MIKYAAIAALILCLGLAAALFWVTGQRDAALVERDRLKAEVASQRAALAQRAEADAVHRIYLKQAEDAARQAAAAETEIMTEEGADADLSPYLRRALDRVR